MVSFLGDERDYFEVEVGHFGDEGWAENGGTGGCLTQALEHHEAFFEILWELGEGLFGEIIEAGFAIVGGCVLAPGIGAFGEGVGNAVFGGVGGEAFFNEVIQVGGGEGEQKFAISGADVVVFAEPLADEVDLSGGESGSDEELGKVGGAFYAGLRGEEVFLIEVDEGGGSFRLAGEVHFCQALEQTEDEASFGFTGGGEVFCEFEKSLLREVGIGKKAAGDGVERGEGGEEMNPYD